MKASENAKYVQDIPTPLNDIRVDQPFRMATDNKRRYIRLEISSPMSMKKIRDMTGNYWPDGDWHVIHGMILNISAGGVLVEIDQAVDEGDVVSMHFTLQEVEGLDHVLGLIKRVDIESDGCIVGIEFITRDHLVDHFTQAELDLLGDNYTNFDESIRNVLNRYVKTAHGQE
jgi:hypothetical protein